MCTFNMRHGVKQEGFIALISILILSAVLLVTTLGLAQFGIANRFFILNIEQKSASNRLAEACVHVARIKTYNDPTETITSAVSVPVADSTCTIIALTPVGSNTTIKAKGQSGDAVTNLVVVVDNTTGDFTSWTEVSSF